MEQKCGMGYPTLGLPCVRPRGHNSPTSICFAVINNQGVFMYQDEKVWVPKDEWPKDAILKEDE